MGQFNVLDLFLSFSSSIVIYLEEVEWFLNLKNFLILCWSLAD